MTSTSTLRNTGHFLIGLLLGASACTMLCFAKLHDATNVFQTQAASILNDVADLRVGVSKVDSVSKIVAKYNGSASLSQLTCSPSNCDFTIAMDNSIMWRFGLAPKAELGILLQVRNSILTRTATSIQVDTKPRILQADIEEGSLNQDAISSNAAIVVHHVTRQEFQKRQDAYSSFNIGCLVKLGGCKDIFEILGVRSHAGVQTTAY